MVVGGEFFCDNLSDERVVVNDTISVISVLNTKNTHQCFVAKMLCRKFLTV